MLVMIGAVAAVSARDSRLRVLGLLVAVAGSPFLADPLPDPRGIVARIAGAALIAHLLLVAGRGRADEPGSRIATWPTWALVTATAVSTVLAAATGPDLPGLVTPAAAGLYLPAATAGTALLVLAAAPVVLAQEPLRFTVGLILAGAAVSLAAASIMGPAGALADLCLAVLLAALAGAGVLLDHLLDRPGRRQARG
jgi:hypothetical protein